MKVIFTTSGKDAASPKDHAWWVVVEEVGCHYPEAYTSGKGSVNTSSKPRHTISSNTS